MSWMRSPQLIAAGNFFFRYRSALFPVIGLFALLFATPRFAFGDRTADAYMDLLGAAIAMAGQVLRAITIGYEYIVRGGREGKVYADNLVQGGVFAHCRNPMYLGNLLIVAGVAVMFNSAPMYFIALPFFIFAYFAIIAAEENFLRAKFGAPYEDYCNRVSRLWIHWKGFRSSTQGMHLNWRRLLIREYGTTFRLLVGFIAIRAYTLFMNLNAPVWPQIEPLLWWLVPIVALYGVVRFLKKSGRLTEYPAARSQPPQGASPDEQATQRANPSASPERPAQP